MKGINPKLKLYCRYWYNRITKTKDEDIESFRWWKGTTCIRSGSHCVVGELHNWDFQYRTKDGDFCGTCCTFSRLLMDTAWVQYSEAFRDNVNQLVDHIEQVHPEIVERCAAR